MQAAIICTNDNTWRLLPFVLLSFLLHLVLLFAIHPSSHQTRSAHQRPLEVFFAPKTIAETSPLSNLLPSETHDNTRIEKITKKQAALPAAAQTKTAIPTATLTPTVTSDQLNVQQLVESSHDIARAQAKKSAQQLTELQKKERNTPMARLQEYLQKPHQEIRLTNGMLKIETEAGAVCFQPAPYFARDSASIFGIPMSCP